jgi:hypothetical protein
MGIFLLANISVLVSCSNPPSPKLQHLAEKPDAECCKSDFNRDARVNGIDLELLLSDWCGSKYDLDGNGIVGAEDLGLLLNCWID